MGTRSAHTTAAHHEVRERILRTASELFYRDGARAIGVDLIAALLGREDEEFWAQWDGVARLHGADAQAELDAHMRWIGERVGRNRYRGCPQLNVAAEFSDEDHPARIVAVAHKKELRRRLTDIAKRLSVRRPDELAAQLLLLMNGAFVSSQAIVSNEAVPILLAASRALVAAGRSAA